ncbi:hypothetical protein Hanom_Chr08g00753691 [Helianthus anomalus]
MGLDDGDRGLVINMIIPATETKVSSSTTMTVPVSNRCRRQFGTFLFHVNDLVKWHEHCDIPENKKMVLHGIIIIACWRIWKARNETIFSGKEPKVVDMIADIKTLGFLWYKHRFKGGVVEWDRWCSFDLM